MLRLFKSYNPYSVLILFFLTIVLKLNFLANPLMPITDSNDLGGLWSYAVNGLVWVFGKAPFFYTFLAALNIFFQAIFINVLANKIDIFSKQNYLAGLSFVIISTFIPDWNYLSQFHLLNWFLIGCLFHIFNLYQTQDANKFLFNGGVVLSLVFLFTTSGLAFVILFLAALNILRPFKLKEWLVFCIGFTMFLYFYAAYLFLTDRLHTFSEIFAIGFYFNAEYSSLRVFLVGLGLVLLSLVWGFIYLSNYMSRMVIKSKKYWSIIIIFLLTAIMSVLFSETKDSLSNWLLILPPVALITANAFYESRLRWLPHLFLYLLIGGTLLAQWVLV